jgi:hypothetical protein
MLTGIRDAREAWAVAEVVDACREERDPKVLSLAVCVIRNLVDIRLTARSDETAAVRKEILDWWEREGKAKYGEAVEEVGTSPTPASDTLSTEGLGASHKGQGGSKF